MGKIKIFFAVIAGLLLGAYLNKCQSPGNKPTKLDCVVDTIYDTIRYIEPAPASLRQIGYKQVKIPKIDIDTACRQTGICADRTLAVKSDSSPADSDSVMLQMPFVQKVYEGKEYKAYVSGVEARMDSIFVYPRREIVTAKKPQKRWHLGPMVGYGCTPRGMGPFVGIGVSYSVVSW